jgi:antitoxin CptB
MSESARVRWKCRRGMLELDLLLGNFLDKGYQRLDANARRRFEQMLEYPDEVLLEWLMGRIVPSDKDVSDIVRRIRSTAMD